MTFKAEPRTGKRFHQRIESENWYLWDNYGYRDGDVIHLYSQAAERKACASYDDRHFSAYWRHFISEDEGENWIDEGPVLCPSDDEKAYDSYTIWSGTVLKRQDGLIMAAYTGLQKGYLALQSMAIAVSDNGSGLKRVSPERPLLSPVLDYDRLVKAGYYLGPRETLGDIEEEADGIFLCFRDPFLFVDNDEKIHIFFGAKVARNSTGVSAIGHAIFTDPDQMNEVEILPPITVPDAKEFNILELPNVLCIEGEYYLIISTSQLAYIGQPDLKAQKEVRIYRSKNLSDGWQPYGPSGCHVLMKPERRLHGLNVIIDSNKTGSRFLCRAFQVGETWLPPTMELVVGGEMAELNYPGNPGEKKSKCNPPVSDRSQKV